MGPFQLRILYDSMSSSCVTYKRVGVTFCSFYDKETTSETSTSPPPQTSIILAMAAAGLPKFRSAVFLNAVY